MWVIRSSAFALLIFGIIAYGSHICACWKGCFYHSFRSHPFSNWAELLKWYRYGCARLDLLGKRRFRICVHVVVTVFPAITAGFVIINFLLIRWASLSRVSAIPPTDFVLDLDLSTFFFLASQLFSSWWTLFIPPLLPLVSNSPTSDVQPYSINSPYASPLYSCAHVDLGRDPLTTQVGSVFHTITIF